jgi:hypothetical protein
MSCAATGLAAPGAQIDGGEPFVIAGSFVPFGDVVTW